MIQGEKKKLTLSVDSEIIEKATKDPEINISEITEKVLRAFTQIRKSYTQDTKNFSR